MKDASTRPSRTPQQRQAQADLAAQAFKLDQENRTRDREVKTERLRQQRLAKESADAQERLLSKGFQPSFAGPTPGLPMKLPHTLVISV